MLKSKPITAYSLRLLLTPTPSHVRPGCNESVAQLCLFLLLRSLMTLKWIEDRLEVCRENNIPALLEIAFEQFKNLQVYLALASLREPTRLYKSNFAMAMRVTHSTMINLGGSLLWGLFSAGYRKGCPSPTSVLSKCGQVLLELRYLLHVSVRPSSGLNGRIRT